MNVPKIQNNAKKDISPYERSDIRRSLWQVTNTTVPFAVLWVLTYFSLSVSFWLALVLAIPTAGFLIRTFIIFHDCCHHSFFKSRRANTVVGIIMGLLTFFPYHKWKFEHSVHHATSGNLNKRGTGDIWTLTVAEYLALSSWKRLVYRLYRNPFVMFGLGPIHIMLIEYRLNRKGAGRKERWNTYGTNVALLVLVGVLYWALGWKFLVVQGLILYISAMAGIWLFYVQHQFEDTYFEKADNWDYVSAALQGSSFYKLPKVLQWMTGNIGLHHIHHLGPRVPNYHLQRVYDNSPQLQNVPSIGLLHSLRSLRYRLWDEENKKFLGFRDLMRRKSGHLS